MNKNVRNHAARERGLKQGITGITVAGFKSIAQERSIDIRPLTILAGANCSGKSSIMQPLLMLKQTLEADYDPGPLRLDGPNVTFSSTEQFLSFDEQDKQVDSFCVGVRIGPGLAVRLCFKRSPSKGMVIHEMQFEPPDGGGTWREGMQGPGIMRAIPKESQRLVKSLAKDFHAKLEWSVIRTGCFLFARAVKKGKRLQEFPLIFSPGAEIGPHIQQIIHIPGHRGDPARTYPKTAFGRRFKGFFQAYVASVIAKWQESDRAKISGVEVDLEQLGLTWRVQAEAIDDVNLELKVGRLAHRTRGVSHQVVNIADVGFGLSQALPVVVALRAAKPGQMVYVEQPEIHLHPKAQFALAGILANAAKRGVRVVAETHSSLLLLGVQSLVASGKLPADLVKLHWFERKSDGTTEVKSADLDKTGAFGPWPEDFGTTELEAERSYLDAARASHLKGSNGK